MQGEAKGYAMAFVSLLHWLAGITGGQLCDKTFRFFRWDHHFIVVI